VVKHTFGSRTQLIHSNHRNEERDLNSHAFPIFQTSTFKYGSVEEGEQIFSGTANHDGYSRISNPNHRFLEKRLCVLEEGEAAQVFDSGMSAIRVALSGFVEMGDHIVAHKNLYGGTYQLLKKLKRKSGIETAFVDARYAPTVIRAITPMTKVVFLETPSNPMLDICDFAEITTFVKSFRKNVVIIVDSTFGTPFNQKPIRHGVDVVIHSLTKYLNGSGRYLGGAIITSQELMNKIWENHDGSGMMDAEVAARIADNLVSAEDRMKRHNRNAEKVVHYLSVHKSEILRQVYYPGKNNHPNFEVARRLMTNFGGMVSFELKDADGSKTVSFLNQLSRDERMGAGIISQLVSLGTTDTLICCPARSTHKKIPCKEKLTQGITDNLIRLSVGTEDVKDIIYSLERGFRAIEGSKN